ncbi:MAG: polysaccharide deacetylase family protein [Cytophagaceae bacterium]|nr:MAG: polysaccharide deacetylase family protein [Cytophagaceae bacterium]
MRPRVSILMYHALVARHEPYQAAVHVEATRFAEQMAWLAASNCRVLPLAAALAALHQPASAAGPPIVALTFDDGYHSLYTQARPVLAQYGFAASLFLTTDAVGQPSYAGQPPEFACSAPRHDRPLTWAELRALAAAGWAIESHGCSHRALAGRPAAEQAAELRQSRAYIAHELGRAPEFFAYPFGSYDRHTLRALGAAGYQAGCSVHTGPATPASDPRRLPRVELRAGCELTTFQQLVETGHASVAEQRRAGLRNLVYRWPLLKDALRGPG